ncbi:Elongator subunit elp4 [Clarireedia jacksonii]
MSFRKRNVAINQPGNQSTNPQPTTTTETTAPIPGIRPSPLDGRPTTSTGVRSLDSILAGHAGLALGTSLLLEENGTTDFGGTLLKYYAAEGILQEHHIHILGMHQGWGRELPGLGAADKSSSAKKDVENKDDKMKIAWRYERLGEFGAATRERNAVQTSTNASGTPAIFCHDFDLSKRLITPSSAQMHFIPTILRPDFEFRDPDESKTQSPYTPFIQHLITQLSRTPATTIHRIIIPSLLSPAFYPPHASQPHHLLSFLHSLRALLRQNAYRLTLMITLPLPLHPRTTALTKWIELLSDGVLELAPFPSIPLPPKPSPTSSGNPTTQEEPPQGMLKIHRLPIYHEKGGGGGGYGGDDLAFSLSRRKGLVVKPYSLPPIEDDEGGESKGGGIEVDGKGGKATKVDIEF